MNGRVEKLEKRLQVDTYPVCVEKPVLIIESYRQTEGEPMVVRNAKALAHYLDNRTIFIEDDELIVGNISSKPMGLEGGTRGPTWSHEDMEDLRNGGYEITPEDEAKLRSLDDYWHGKGRTMFERMGHYYDDDRLWPFIQSGILLPPWKSKEEGRGHGSAGMGWGLGMGLSLIVVDFAKVLNDGLNSLIGAAQKELKTLRYTGADAVKKADFLRAVIIADSAIVRIAQRFGDLAADMALKETNPTRKKNLYGSPRPAGRYPANPRGISMKQCSHSGSSGQCWPEEPPRVADSTSSCILSIKKTRKQERSLMMKYWNSLNSSRSRQCSATVWQVERCNEKSGQAWHGGIILSSEESHRTAKMLPTS